jgi:ATP-dependent DNA ligase I
VLLAEIAQTSQQVAATSARRAKIELLGRCLRAAGPDEAATTVFYLSGELPQRQIGVGYASLRDLPPPATTDTLTVADVDAAFTEIGAVTGKGSVARRRELLHALLAQATALEQDFLIRLLAGELRQGALDGVLTDAVAFAAEVPAAEVRRAAMLRGALGPVATAALATGVEGLRTFGLQVGRPIKPMLAASAATLPDALSTLLPPTPGAEEVAGGVAVEWKLDGIRIQAHIFDGPAGSREVRLFTRTLDDITARLPEVVRTLAVLPVQSAVFDGELIALRPDGRPQPFQVTASRAATRNGSSTEETLPLSIFLFDVLHLDGTDLLDRSGADRHAALAAVVPAELRMPRLITDSADEAAEFFAGAVAGGHEGVVVKSLTAPYAAGRRGAGWIKVKPRHTLDLVVLAAEWGHGRRTGKLSNLHLGARDSDTGGWVMLGKTFKGLTDELLAWQTEKLQELALPPGHAGASPESGSWIVHVRPELVVEIAFDGVQRSSRYPGGMALRFARVLRYRPDKSAAEADTVATVRALATVFD